MIRSASTLVRARYRGRFVLAIFLSGVQSIQGVLASRLEEQASTIYRHRLLQCTIVEGSWHRPSIVFMLTRNNGSGPNVVKCPNISVKIAPPNDADKNSNCITRGSVLLSSLYCRARTTINTANTVFPRATAACHQLPHLSKA